MDVARILLNNSADVNMRSKDGAMPIHLAVEKGIHSLKFVFSHLLILFVHFD